MNKLVQLIKGQPLLKDCDINTDAKITLLYFWDTRCLTCVEKIPEQVRVYHKYKNLGFEMIGICLDEDKEELIDFVNKNNMTWPLIFDGKSWSSELTRSFNINSVPVEFFFNKDGDFMNLNLEAQILGFLAI